MALREALAAVLARHAERALQRPAALGEVEERARAATASAAGEDGAHAIGVKLLLRRYEAQIHGVVERRGEEKVRGAPV